MEELFGFCEIEPGRRFEKELPAGRLRLKRLLHAAEIEPYLELLNQIWGFDGREALPLHEAVVVVMTGGLFLGVDLERDRVGVVYVMPAYTREWGYHHHSNFMGYLTPYRSLGIGMEAKRLHAVLAAREGVELVTWTFDPLMVANANLNFRKLGCVCRTYLPDLYPGMGGSFEQGLPTDRFLVEWRLSSPRVRSRLAGRCPSPEELAAGREDAPVLGIEAGAGEADLDRALAVLVRIPVDVHQRAGSDPAGARADLVRLREIFQKLFGRGFTLTEMIRAGVRDEGAYYLLEKGGGR